MTRKLRDRIPLHLVVFALASATWGLGCGGDDFVEEPAQPEMSPFDSDPNANPDNGDEQHQLDPTLPTGVSELVTGEGIFLGLDGADDLSVLLPFYVTPDGDTASLYETEVVTFTLSTESQDKLAGTLADSFGIPEFLITPYLKDPKKLVKITGAEVGSVDVQTKLSLLDDTPVTAPTTDSRITVIEYTPEQIALGKSSYEANGCAACHEGGSSGAPAHTLGLVALMSDSRILELLEEGTPFMPDTEVTFEHQYTFSSDDERLGMAGNLRVLQEKDVDLLVNTVVDCGDLSIFGL